MLLVKEQWINNLIMNVAELNKFRKELSMMATPYFLFRDLETKNVVRCVSDDGTFNHQLVSEVIHNLKITDSTKFDIVKTLDCITILTLINDNDVVKYRVYGMYEAIANNLE